MCTSRVIVAQNTAWPANLALQQIAVLKLKAGATFNAALHVKELAIHGMTQRELDLSTITVKKVRILNTKPDQKVIFKDATPHVLNLHYSQAELVGIVSVTMTELSLFQLSPENTSLDISTVGWLKIQESGMVMSKFLHELVVAGPMRLEDVQIVSLPVQSVQGDVIIYLSQNVPLIEFPLLVNVSDSFVVAGPGVIESIELPRLEKVKRFRISSRVMDIDIPDTITWEEESFINLQNFCIKHFEGFAANNRFRETEECHSQCKGSIIATRVNIKNLHNFKYLQEIVINGESIDLVFPRVERIFGSLTLKDFTANAHFPVLKQINGQLKITGNSTFSGESFSGVEVGSLKIEVTHKLETVTIEKIKQELLIHNSTVQAVAIKSSKICQYHLYY